MAAEIGFWRRDLRVSWTNRISNERALDSIWDKKKVCEYQQKETATGPGVCDEKREDNLCSAGRPEGTRTRRKQREKFVDGKQSHRITAFDKRE